jgi:inorganic triphosphatase YgiF
VKNIAFMAGIGIPLALYITTRSPRRKPESSGGTDPYLIEPLLDRIEQLEAQSAKVGANGAETSQAQALQQTIAAQEAQLQTLRVKVYETESRAATAVEEFETRLQQLRQDLPSLVEAKVAAQMRELSSKIEAQVEVQVAKRIGALERAMADQLTSIGGLRDRAVDSDANLQRLIAVVERLCDRPLQPSSTMLPFEAQLAEAVQRDVAVESHARVIKESEPDRRHRFPLGRTFAFLLAALLPGFYRR